MNSDKENVTPGPDTEDGSERSGSDLRSSSSGEQEQQLQEQQQKQQQQISNNQTDDKSEKLKVTPVSKRTFVKPTPYRDYLSSDQEESDDELSLDGSPIMKAKHSDNTIKLERLDLKNNSPSMGVRIQEKKLKDVEQDNLGLRIKVREYEKILKGRAKDPNFALNGSATNNDDFRASSATSFRSQDANASVDLETQKDVAYLNDKTEALEKENQDLQNTLADLKRQLDMSRAGNYERERERERQNMNTQSYMHHQTGSSGHIPLQTNVQSRPAPSPQYHHQPVQPQPVQPFYPLYSQHIPSMQPVLQPPTTAAPLTSPEHHYHHYYNQQPPQQQDELRFSSSQRSPNPYPNPNLMNRRAQTASPQISHYSSSDTRSTQSTSRLHNPNPSMRPLHMSQQSSGRGFAQSQSPTRPHRAAASIPTSDIQEESLDAAEHMAYRNSVLKDVVDGVVSPDAYFNIASDTVINRLTFQLYKVIRIILALDIFNPKHDVKYQAILAKCHEKFADQDGQLFSPNSSISMDSSMTLNSEDRFSSFTGNNNGNRVPKTDITDMLKNIILAIDKARNRVLDSISQQQNEVEDLKTRLADEVRRYYDSYCDVESVLKDVDFIMSQKYPDYDAEKLVSYIVDTFEVIGNLEQEINDLEAKNSDLEKAVSHKDKVVEETEKFIKTVESKMEKELRLKDLAIDEIKQLNEQLVETHKSEVKSLKDSHAAELLAAEKLKEEDLKSVDSLKAEMEQLKQQLRSADIQNAQLTAQCNELSEANVNLTKKCEHLEAENHSLVELQKAIPQRSSSLYFGGGSNSSYGSSANDIIEASKQAWKEKNYHQMLKLQEANKKLESERVSREEKLRALEHRVKASKKLSLSIFDLVIRALKPYMGESWVHKVTQEFARLPEGTSDRVDVKIKMFEHDIAGAIERLASMSASSSSSSSMSDEARMWKAQFEKAYEDYKQERESYITLQNNSRDLLKQHQEKIELYQQALNNYEAPAVEGKNKQGSDAS